MSKPIQIAGYRGMVNTQKSSSHLVDKAGLVTPTIVLNADISVDMSLTKRDGYARKISLPNPHSLWAGSVMLCVSAGKLYKLEGTRATELCDITGNPSYSEINGIVYISSSTFTGIYEPNTATVRDWGTALPGSPSISLASGGMPPGRYCLCYTRLRADGQISGSGPIVEIEWSGDSAGIELLNLESDYLAWITDVNGTDLYLATVESGKIISPHYDKPLPSLFCAQPKKMSEIAYSNGRMWGIAGKSLYYSEPMAYEWWQEANCFPFGEELVMVAPVLAGIFVASRNTTWVLKGTDPAKMTVEICGDGMVPGTLVYDEFQQSGQEIETWKHKSLLPTWMSQSGFVIGNEHLYLVNLTEERLDIKMGRSGAALSRKVGGQVQILMTMPCTDNGDIGNAFNVGRIFIPGPVDVIGSGGIKITS